MDYTFTVQLVLVTSLVEVHYNGSQAYGLRLVVTDMYPLYWTISKGGFFMRYTYEFKKHCVDLYRKGQYPKTPEGFSQRGFRMMVRRWCRSVEIHGFKVLKHKKRNRV